MGKEEPDSLTLGIMLLMVGLGKRTRGRGISGTVALAVGRTLQAGFIPFRATAKEREPGTAWRGINLKLAGLGGRTSLVGIIDPLATGFEDEPSKNNEGNTARGAGLGEHIPKSDII